MNESITPRTRGRGLGFVAGAAFMCVLSAGIGAGAATLVTSAQIKNGTIVGVDVKNGGLTGKDLKNGSVTGKDVKDGSIAVGDLSTGVGVEMVNGRIPSGTTVTGLATLDIASNVAGDFSFAVDLPGRAHAVLVSESVNFGGDDPRVADSSAECTGTVDAPTAPAGQVCLYLLGATSDSSSIQGTAVGGTGSDRTFLVYWNDANSSSPDVFMTAAWAYTAP